MESALPKVKEPCGGGGGGPIGEGKEGGCQAGEHKIHGRITQVQLLWVLTKTLTPSNHDLPSSPRWDLGNHQPLLQVIKVSMFPKFTRNTRINILWNLVIPNLCEVCWPGVDKIFGAEERIKFKQSYDHYYNHLRYYAKALCTSSNLILTKSLMADSYCSNKTPEIQVKEN